MKQYPHQPTASVLSEMLTTTRTRYQKSKRKLLDVSNGKNWYLLESLWVQAIDLAALESAFAADRDVVHEHWKDACSYVEELLQLSSPIGTNIFRITLALTNLLPESPFRHQLENIERPALTKPNVICDELDFLSAEMMKYLSSGDIDSTLECVKLAEKRANEGTLSTEVNSTFLPLVKIGSAILHRRTQELDTSMEEQIAAHVAWFSPPDMRSIPTGLVDYVGFGLRQIARKAELESSVSSPYHPIEYL